MDPIKEKMSPLIVELSLEPDIEALKVSVIPPIIKTEIIEKTFELSKVDL